jgi:membrane protease YdiL (CAAX protease family)
MKKAETSAFAPSLQPIPVQLSQLSLLVFVWIATLLVSALPAILIQELHIALPFSILWMRVALLVGFIGLSFMWKGAQPLRAYFVIFLVLYLTDGLFNWIGGTAAWKSWFGTGTTFTSQMMSSQILRLGTALVMIAALWIIYRQRHAFFLTAGELDATAKPVRWIGMDKPMGWKRFGVILAVCITLGTLAFLIISGRPSGDVVVNVLPLLPVVLIAAVLNAFSEEVTFRAALLSPLHGVVGQTQALLLTAALFGLWHFYGVPYGVVGVVMAGALGWILGKSMLETRGIFWAWFIHFWQDVAIFIFIAMGSITAGG